jgi:Prion-inhibition and propagation
MAIEPFGVALGVASLLACFKGAIDGYILIKSVFDKDNGLKDLASRFHVVQISLNEWLSRFDALDPDYEKSLLQYETDENKKLIFEILGRIKEHLADAQKFLFCHTREPAQRTSSNILDRFKKSRGGKRDALDSHGEDDAPKSRVLWAIKNKAKFGEVVATLEAHYGNLVRCSKHVEILRLNNWAHEVKKLTNIDEHSPHTRAQQLRQEGTGQWILQRTEFRKWFTGEAKDILWVHAIRKFSQLCLVLYDCLIRDIFSWCRQNHLGVSQRSLPFIQTQRLFLADDA